MASRTGADAMYKAIFLGCRTLRAYHTKLDIFIDAAVTASVITSGEGVAAHAFVDGLEAVCVIFHKLAEYNSLAP